MKKYLIFGGTSEGVVLAKALSEAGHSVTVSVATDYGAFMLEGISVEVLVGRLDAAEMEKLIQTNRFSVVLDATHPYAAEVTKNILLAAEKTGVSYERILRSEGAMDENWQVAADVTEAVKMLSETEGNVLLTTGSKELAAFAVIPEFQRRLYIRILPSLESLRKAIELGYPPNCIIAMHGPFSTELNLAMLRQYGIQTLVTKRSGRAGGFWEKAEAAKEAGASLLVIDRPLKEVGLTMEEAIEKYR